MPNRKRKQSNNRTSKARSSKEKVVDDKNARHETISESMEGKSDSISTIHATRLQNWSKFAFSVLATFHVLILLASLSTNRDRSFLGDQISNLIGPYCQLTNLVADRLPLEITHAQTLEGPYRLLFATSDSTSTDIEFQSVWTATGVGDMKIQGRINRRIAVELFEGNDESVAELMRGCIAKLSSQTKEKITRVRFVATLLLDRDQYAEAGAVSIDEEILLDLQVVKVGDEIQLLQMSEDRKAARSTARPTP